MEIKDFILENIEYLINSNKVERVRYGISKCTGSYIIEITPQSIFSNSDFIQMESEIIDQFETLFPKDELIFISNDDIITLENCIVYISGNKKKLSSLYPVHFSPLQVCEPIPEEIYIKH